MNSKYKKEFGALGEEKACEYLKKQKYHVLERNFRIKNGEVDIIAIDQSQKEKVLVFIEVKIRVSDAYGDPLEAIGYYKLQALTRTALFYQTLHPGLPELMRLDAVGILLNGQGKLQSINLVKNIS